METNDPKEFLPRKIHAYHICAIFNGLLGVEGSLLSSEALTIIIRTMSNFDNLSTVNDAEKMLSFHFYLAYDLALLGEQHVWPSLQ